MPAANRRGRIAFALLLATILGGGLVSLLLLNTLSAQDAFRLAAQNTKLTQLDDTEQALRLQLQTVSSPAALAADAARLGMVAAVPGPVQSVHGGELRALLVPAPVVGTLAAGLPSASTPATATSSTPTTTTPSTTTPSTQPSARASSHPSTQPSARASSHPSTQPSAHATSK
ncbi:MAG: hypothetical protein ACYCO3_02755 [Mycobacteriales bacterium]